MPEGTTYWGVVLKQVLLGLSIFPVGVLLYRTVFFERRRHRPFLAVGFLSVAGIIMLVAEAVIRIPLLNPTWQLIGYLICLTGVFVGFLGDAIRTARRMQNRRYDD